MSEQTYLPVTERLSRLFQHLGIQRAHVAAAGGLEPAGLAEAHPELIASLTFVCPSQFDARRLRSLPVPLLLIHGDKGPASSLVPRALPELPEATEVVLEDFVDVLWSDPVADRQPEIAKAIHSFLAEADRQAPVASLDGDEERGEIAGITYHVQGNGPPLVLFPLNLARSQWELLISPLSQHYRTYTLGGSHLWPMSAFEQRFYATEVVQSFLKSCAPQPGDRVLDVGCGSGVITRWLAQNSQAADPVVGVDINPYLLREASVLAAAEGLEASVQFQEGDAESLPFQDGSFDLTLSLTVLEEGNADRMLAELVRVTKPGGRIGVIVRALDVAGWDNLDLPKSIQAKFAGIPASPFGSDSTGCADASLYPRLRAIGLTDMTMGPQLAVFHADPRYEQPFIVFQSSRLAALEGEEAETWRTIATEAKEDGTLMFAIPVHCAIGSKPYNSN